jgi:hypothetical protein
MNPKQARAAFRHHEKKMAELRANTIVDPNNMLEVINEGTLHMVEHFTPAIGPQYKKDYVFVMGKAFLGMSKDNGTADVQACSFFHCGDTHEWSHDLADLMAENPELYDFVMHAIHICHLKKFSGK